MRNLSLLLLASSSLCTSPAMAADAKIGIISPTEGTKLDVMEQHKLEYEITPGGGANHAHLYVDGKEKALLRQRKGSVTLDPLTHGSHEICAKMVNKNHTPVGIEHCIKVTAE